MINNYLYVDYFDLSIESDIEKIIWKFLILIVVYKLNRLIVSINQKLS